MPADPLLVRARDLEAVYASGDGVGPVDLDLAAGEDLLVLGPSGCGKSTLLRCLTGAVPHAVDASVRGSVVVGGVDVATSSVAALAHAVGAVAQDPQTGVCLPDVDDEVAFPLENRCADPASIGPAVAQALAVVGASDLGGRSTTELSGGELQRVALAAALVGRPALLVLDEPTSMLDGPGLTAVREAVESGRRTTSAAVVLVEHRLDEYAGDAGVDGLPGRTLVLDRGGRVVADGASADVFARHATDLLAMGCWLPLDAELAAVTGRAGGLASAGVRAAVLALALDAPRSRARPGGEPLDLEGATVTASRSTRPVLRDVSVRLHRGELVALVGRNGSGKTTLLRCLAGLARPAAGRLRGPRAGLVFQHPEHQLTQSSVRREVAYGLPAEREPEVTAWLERFGLDAFADHDPFRLSGGQQRRLGLAAMLVHRRPFLLADEPGYGLDRRATVTVMRSLSDLVGEGQGVCFSSHDLRTLCAYADRVLVVGEGRLVADTTPLALLRDETALTAAGLRLPPLLRWLRDEVGTDGDLRAVLQGLDAQVLRAQAPDPQRPVAA
ncbi:ABC transporter ATP-binding protein [Microlunatus flavus]|uniref:Energy-coupling factor transport system ATP-binding protein n=1 Tax=Microlunatus flavus TaxID=1036181 RepID=A0A1H9A4T1_9ACTN|nr:ABC transporter ATP-binding protein [Microlunatus flavus]SEP71669.1 energy-coupling factor transport system ATP-binding protein [Microlunatus flavus]